MGRIQPGVIRRSDVMRIMTCGRAAENSSFPFFFFVSFLDLLGDRRKIKEKNNFDFRWALPIFLSLQEDGLEYVCYITRSKNQVVEIKGDGDVKSKIFFFSDAWFRQQPFSKVRLVLPIVAASRKR